jgi:dUTP pyrophosphatase
MKIAKVRDVKTPERGTVKSAGIDFFVPNDFIKKFLPPQCDMLIPSGIKAQIPEGFMLMAAEKSGVVTSKRAAIEAGRTPKPAAYTTVVVLGAKIVDEDYQGEIHIHLVNVGDDYVVIEPGTKIAQFILVPVSYENIEVVPEDQLFLEVSDRGDGGFGSTGDS